jgi:hypothetical protein
MSHQSPCLITLLGSLQVVIPTHNHQKAGPDRPHYLSPLPMFPASNIECYIAYPALPIMKGRDPRTFTGIALSGTLGP